MLKYNNTHIFTGYLKQLLSSFNLPKFRVFTKEEANINSYIIHSAPESREHPRTIYYIKNNVLQYTTDGINWIGNKVFNYNTYIRNHTKTLKITNNIYDSYTHEYLGDYLRFQRDYNNIDLMPLYNCFSNRVCTDLKVSGKGRGSYFNFDTADPSFKIYMLPVKLFKKYTIAIDCWTDVEFCCGLYGQYYRADQNFNLMQNTYFRKHNSQFNTPFLYTKLTEIQDYIAAESITELAQNEQDLKLFIKIPVNNTSSIAILEGDYTKYNDNGKLSHNIGNLFYDSVEQSYKLQWKQKNKPFQHNVSILNFENTTDFDTIPLITELQLLKQNTGESYPMSDRLIEYLMDNVITDLDEISDNVKRVQSIIKNGVNYDIKSIFNINGLWDDSIKYILYEYMTSRKLLTNESDKFTDVLGYVDKDVEALYKNKNNALIDADIYDRYGGDFSDK